MLFCVVIYDNIYKIVIKMDYFNWIRLYVKVKLINYYVIYRKIYRRYFFKFNMGKYLIYQLQWKMISF